MARLMLNDEQKKVIKKISGPIRVIAGPGSGKTRTIVYRIANLIKSGAAPSSVLAITFTNKSAREMKKRIASLISLNKEQVFVSTFHSFCAKLIRKNHNLIDDFRHDYTILDASDQKSLIKKIIKELDIAELEINFKEASDFISYFKINSINVTKDINKEENITEKHKYEIFESYVEYQKQNNALDFDDLIIKAIEILEKNPQVKKYYNTKFKYIHVDEFQDTNPIQYHLIKLLVNSKNNICVVGDPNQNIYSWRGSDIKIILDFDKDFPKTETIYLNKNYRSTKNILAVANKFANISFSDENRTLITSNPKGDLISYYEGLYEDDEAAWITAKIFSLAEQGVNLSDITILYRLSYLSRAIEFSLMSSGIKFKVNSGIRFFERKEIKIALSYLRFSIQKDDISFEKIISFPKRGIGEQKVNEIRNLSRKYHISAWDVIKNHQKEVNFTSKQKIEIDAFIKLFDSSPGDADKNFTKGFKEVLVKSKYWELLSNSPNPAKIENLKELLNSIKINCDKNPNLTAGKYLSDVSLNWLDDDNDEDGVISLMTIHKAKGIENKHIFIMGVSETLLPSVHAISKNDVEEERRVFYVAVTRAISNLYLTYSKQKGASRFLFDIDHKYLQEGTWQTKPLMVEDKIKHDTFGDGVVLNLGDNTVEIDFGKEFGVKTLLKNHKSIKRV